MRRLITILTLASILLMGVSCSSGSGSDPIPPTKANIVMGEYYGDIEDNGNGNFYLMLVSGKMDSQGDFIGSGSAIMLDMYSELATDPNNASLVPGTYNVAKTMAHFTLYPGFYDSSDDDYYGSIYVLSEGTQNYTFHEIVAGSVTVAKSGAAYTITAKLKTKSGMDVNYLYSGEIVFDNYAEYPMWE